MGAGAEAPPQRRQTGTEELPFCTPVAAQPKLFGLGNQRCGGVPAGFPPSVRRETDHQRDRYQLGAEALRETETETDHACYLSEAESVHSTFQLKVH